MGKLEGKVAVITGGNSGIGLATAKEFKEQGARIVITGRDQATLDEAKRKIGGDVLAVRSDAASLTEIDKLFAAVKQKFGNIDVLFINPKRSPRLRSSLLVPTLHSSWGRRSLPMAE